MSNRRENRTTAGARKQEADRNKRDRTNNTKDARKIKKSKGNMYNNIEKQP